MDKFLARSGRIHFLFADQGPYYLESLVAYQLNDYLGYQLRRNGFKRLYYINTGATSDGRWFVQMYDSFSAEAFLPYVTKSGFLKFNRNESVELKYDNEENRRSVTAIHGSKDTLLSTLLKIYNNTDNSAFIFSFPCFSSIFDTSETRKGLKDVVNIPKNNLIVLTASRDSTIWLQSMENRNGVFQSELFPEFSDLCTADMDLYEYLDNKLDMRFHVWKDRTEENIRRMLKRELLHLAPGSCIEITHLDIFARIIYLLTTSQDFRDDFSHLIPYRSGMTFEQTIQYCLDKSNAATIEKWIQRMDEKGLDPMTLLDDRRYFRNRKTRFYTLETGLAEEFYKLPINNILPLLDEDRAAGFKDFIYNAANVLDSPRTCPEKAYVQDALDYALEELARIGKNGNGATDIDHLSDIYSLIRYALFDNEREKDASVFEKKLSYRKACAELSGSVQEAKERLEKDYENIEQLRGKIDSLMESIQNRPRWEEAYAIIRQIPKMGEDALKNLTPLLNDKEIRELVSLSREKGNLELICQGLSSRAESEEQNRTRIMIVLDKITASSSGMEIGKLLQEISVIVQDSYKKEKEDSLQSKEAGIEIDQLIQGGNKNDAVREMSKSIMKLFG